jgi:uncharacterized membrane protein
MQSFASAVQIRRALLALVSLAAVQLSSAAVQFYGAGQIAGGDFASQARDAKILPDGSLLMVGTLCLFPDDVPAGDTSVAWTPAGGWRLLANPYPSNPHASFVTARIISADGKIIGGSQRAAPTGPLRSPCLWTNNGNTVQLLGFLPGAGNVHPNVGLNCLSADGAVAYGFDCDAPGTAAFRYTAAGGLVDLGYLHADDVMNTPAAHGCSADGTVMAGNSTGGVSLLGAYRYDYTGKGPKGGTLTPLPALPGGTTTSAIVITLDGKTIVGSSDSPDYPLGQLVTWRSHGGAHALGSPSTAWGMNNLAGVTNDGQAIVIAVGPPDGSSSVSYVRNRHGWIPLQPLLAAAGADVAAWTLDSVLGCSNDGTVLFGSGQHLGQQEAWVAVVPPGFLKHAGAADDDSSDDNDAGD